MQHAAPLPIPWLTRLRMTRDRLLGNSGFQRWAAAFPLTRPIARKRARALFDLVSGFVYSQILLACVRLNLFDILGRGPASVDRLAAEMSLTPDATSRLLDAAASIGLVEKRGENEYGLGYLGASLAGNRAIAGLVEHHAMVYADLRDPVALLRGTVGKTATAEYWPYSAAEVPAELDDRRIAAYSDLMSISQPLVAGEILAAYPLHRHRCLLDLGGGDGTFLTAVAARHPRLNMMLFDLPAVAARASQKIAAAGLAGRIAVAGGDFLRDPLPTGADIISLVRIIHDHDDERVLTVLQAARRALPAGGTLLIAEPLAGLPGSEAIGDAYFGFYLLAMGRGRARTVAQLSGLLQATGFSAPKLHPTNLPMQTSVLSAIAVTA